MPRCTRSACQKARDWFPALRWLWQSAGELQFKDEGFVLGRLSMPESYKCICGATHVWSGTSFIRMQGRDV